MNEEPEQARYLNQVSLSASACFLAQSMNNFHNMRSFHLLHRTLVWLILLFTFTAGACSAGFRAPGDYCGVVTFDRWGGCTLYSGIYVMYISEKIKDSLRPYAGKCVKIDATKVDQPINPGDGLIQECHYVGHPPPDPVYWSTDGIAITAAVDVTNQDIVVDITNKSKKSITVDTSQLAPTILAQQSTTDLVYHGPSDGPSYALITRQAFTDDFDGTPSKFSGLSVDPTTSVPLKLSLLPNENKTIKIDCTLPPGEYEFLCGYGGGVHEYISVCSNLVPFDVAKDGGLTTDVR